jgi:hypothetical protein
VKSAGDAVLETEQTCNGLPGLGVHCRKVGNNNCFFFFFNETGSRDDVGPSCSLEGSPTGQCVQVSSCLCSGPCRWSVWFPASATANPPKKVWTFVPCPNRVLWFCGVQRPADCADQTKATAECGAAMWLAGDNAW